MKTCGPGNIIKLGHRRYRARITIWGRIHSKNCRTRELCEVWLRKMRRRKILDEADPERRDAPDATRPRITYRELEAEYLEAIKASSLGPRARRHTEQTLMLYLSQAKLMLEHWGARVISQTVPEDVRAYVQKLREEGLATSGIRHRLDRVAHFMKLAHLKGYISRIPCEVIRPALVVSDEPVATSEDAVRELLERARAHRDRRLPLLVLLAADAGLRREEILRLQLSHVELAGDGESYFGWIRVASINEDLRTKSGKGRRVPIFTRRLAAALEDAGARFDADRAAIEGIKTRDGISQMAAKIGAPLHELRARMATRLGWTGTPAPKIQRWLGHAQLSTTQGYMRGDDLPFVEILAPREALEAGQVASSCGESL